MGLEGGRKFSPRFFHVVLGLKLLLFNLTRGLNFPRYCTDKYLPFSSSIRADHYLKLKRLEYHSKQTIRQILEKALELYLNPKKQPQVHKPLPPTEAAKMKPLKTALDYYYDRQKD